MFKSTSSILQNNFLNQSENAVKKRYKMSFQTKVLLYLSCGNKYSHAHLRSGPRPKPVCQKIYSISLLDTLATRKNMVLWGQTNDDRCTFCLQSESLLHVVAGCKSYLDEGRYTWRHNSVLLFLSKVFAKAKYIQLFADLDDFHSPCIITGHSLRPDMLIIFNHTRHIIELTMGFESNVNANSLRKKRKYLELVDTFSQKCDAVKFVNVSMGTLGMFGTSCDTFVTMLNEVGTTQNQKDYVL